jgi:hypothetical protein
MYQRIVNPETGRLVNITSQLGQKIINRYLMQIGGGYVDCDKGRGAKKRCRKADKKNGCEYIKADAAAKKGVSSYGCYKLEEEEKKLNAKPAAAPTKQETKNDGQDVAKVWGLYLSNEDDEDEPLQLPDRPKGLPEACFILEERKKNSIFLKSIDGEKCYEPTWTGKTDEDGNRSITCVSQDEVNDMWRKHYQNNEIIRQERKKSKLVKNQELQRVLSQAREGDLIEDLSQSGYRTEGVSVIKRNSKGKLEVQDLDTSIDDYGMVGYGFSLGPKYPLGYWKNAQFEKAYWHADPLQEPVHKDILSNLKISDLDEEDEYDKFEKKMVPFTYAYFEWGTLRFPGQPTEVFDKIQEDTDWNIYDDDLAYFEEVTPGIAQIVDWQWDR